MTSHAIPSTAEVVAVLENIAQLLELEGENPFKTRAYVRAARALESLSEPLEKLVVEQRLSEIDGVGKALEEKITELVTTGRSSYHEELRSHFPETLFELFELQGLGAKKIHTLYKELHVTSVDELEKACQSGAVASLTGFGEKSAENFKKAILFHRSHVGLFRRDEVTPLVVTLLEDLRTYPAVGRCESAGSFRRGKEALGDLDLLVSSTKPEEVTAFFVHHPLVIEVLTHGPTKVSVRLKIKNSVHASEQSSIQCDLRVVRPEEFPFALVYFTGSKEHNIRLRSRALEHGWSLNEYSFTPQQGAAPAPSIYEEGELYRALGLVEIPPELREDRGEIDAAECDRIPNLIKLSDLKGTFHCHTKESDGENTLLEMAVAAQELGLSYLGIADHSKSSVQAHGMSEERLFKQVEEIKKLNKTFDGFHLFAGVECDILKEGTLDFSDEILASLDYVVASVHSSFSLGEAEMTKRIIRAIENPYVTILGHMTGRILFSRPPYAVNVPAVLDAAAATGTVIELNASPYRLDLDWRWWPLAKEKGVRCVINPDAHSIEGLQNLLFGVTIARKGWLTKKEVINTFSTKVVQDVLREKRSKKSH